MFTYKQWESKLDKIEQRDQQGFASDELSDPSSLRYWLNREDNFNTQETYTFLHTTANPDVDKFLKENKEDLKSRGYFSEGLLNRFHSHIEETLSAHFSYSPITKEYGLSVNPFLPKVHVLKGDSEIRVQEFREIIANLLSNEVYEKYIEKEEPHNYNMPALRLLKECSNFSPLLILPRITTFNGEQVKNAIDFMLPYYLKPKPDYSNMD